MEQAFGTGTTVQNEKLTDLSVPSTPEGHLTGGSISPDGKRVMLCDLEGGYEWSCPTAQPTRTPSGGSSSR